MATREKAFEALKRGLKVRPPTWPKGQWIKYCINGKLMDQTGYMSTFADWEGVEEHGWVILHPKQKEILTTEQATEAMKAGKYCRLTAWPEDFGYLRYRDGVWTQRRGSVTHRWTQEICPYSHVPDGWVLVKTKGTLREFQQALELAKLRGQLSAAQTKLEELGGNLEGYKRGVAAGRPLFKIDDLVRIKDRAKGMATPSEYGKTARVRGFGAYVVNDNHQFATWVMLDGLEFVAVPGGWTECSAEVARQKHAEGFCVKFHLWSGHLELSFPVGANDVRWQFCEQLLNARDTHGWFWCNK